MSEYTKTMYSEIDKIREISQSLEQLAYAFSTTGNEKVCKQLFVMSDDLLSSVDEMFDQVSKEIDARYVDAQQNSINILNTILANKNIC